MHRSLLTRLAIGATALVATAGTISLSAGTANAADPDETFPNPTFPNSSPFVTDAHYNVTGTAHIKNKNAKVDVPLGPTRITADVGTPDGNEFDYFASLPLPPKNVSFKAFGYLPVRAKVSFTQVGPAVGSIDTNGNTITGDAKYVVSLSDVLVGYTKANVGPNCQTRYPVDVNFGSTAFNLFDGGDLTATFDIGKFNNCGTSTDLANLIVPGTGNALNLHLGGLYLGDDSPPEAAQMKKIRAAVAK